MAKASDKEMALAGVYASSMLELAEKQGEADHLLKELNDVVALLRAHPDFGRLFANPTIDAKAREATIEKVFRGRKSDLLVDSLQVLNRKGRLELFQAVVDTYRHAHQTARGHVEVFVRTAVPLKDSLRDEIRSAVATRTGLVPDLVESVDAALLGGLIVQVGDRKLDGSVARQLERVGAALRDRASREVHSGSDYVVA